MGRAPRPGGYRDFETTTGGTALRRSLGDIETYLKASSCPSRCREDALIVLAEVLNNIEEHAYSGQTGRTILVRVAIGPDTLACCVEDYGSAMPERALPPGHLPDIEPAVPQSWPEGGYGWAIVRQLARTVDYERIGGKNRLRFTFGPVRTANSLD